MLNSLFQLHYIYYRCTSNEYNQHGGEAAGAGSVTFLDREASGYWFTYAAVAPNMLVASTDVNRNTHLEKTVWE
jgi:hypothetical protein